MTVPYIDPTITYVHDNPGRFDFNFDILSAENISAYVIDNNGQIHHLVINTDYTVYKLAHGGYIITTTNLVGKITIYRDIPYTQEVDWVNAGPLDLEILEDSFDKNCMLIQQIFSKLNAGNITTNWTGDWISGYHYVKMDIVIGPDKNIYNCVEEHTSNVFANDMQYWMLVADLASTYTARDEAVSAANDANTSSISALASASAAASSQVAANSSATSAQSDADNAHDDAIKSHDYAVNPYNTVIPGTTDYSSLHWATVAQNIVQIPISNPNLLINPEFTVNQKEYVFGTNVDTEYGCDMWLEIMGSGNGYYRNSDGSITLKGDGSSGCGLMQTNEKLLERSRVLTVSVKSGQVNVHDLQYNTDTIVDAAHPYTFNFLTQISNGPLGTTNGIVITTINAQDTTFYGLKVEEGDTATNFVPTDYTTEFLKCSRYFQEITSTIGLDESAGGYRYAKFSNAQFIYVDTNSKAIADVLVQLKVPMRAIPEFYYLDKGGGTNIIFPNPLYNWDLSDYVQVDYFNLSTFKMTNSNVYIGYCTWTYYNGLNIGPPINLRTLGSSTGATLFFDARYKP